MKTITKLAFAAAAALAAYPKVKDHYINYPPAPKVRDGVRRVACVGDSITYSAGVANKRHQLGWPALLQEKLGGEYQTLNYGLCGRTLLTTGNRPYIREDFYLESFRCKPEMVLVLLGTNDAKPYNWDAARFEKELREFLSRYIAVGARVVVLKPSKCFVVEGSDEVGYDILNEHIEEELPIIDRVAAELGVGTVDLYSLTEDHPDWFDDGVHPNAAGNAAFAERIYEAVFADGGR